MPTLHVKPSSAERTSSSELHSPHPRTQPARAPHTPCSEGLCQGQQSSWVFIDLGLTTPKLYPFTLLLESWANPQTADFTASSKHYLPSGCAGRKTKFYTSRLARLLRPLTFPVISPPLPFTSSQSGTFICALLDSWPSMAFWHPLQHQPPSLSPLTAFPDNCLWVALLCFIVNWLSILLLWADSLGIPFCLGWN